MAVWARADMIFPLRRSDTGKYDTATHTVKLVACSDASEITCTQLDSLYCYKPDSNGSTEEAYDIYVDAVKKGKRLYGPDLIMPIGG
jgi:hypothetical protein